MKKFLNVVFSAFAVLAVAAAFALPARAEDSRVALRLYADKTAAVPGQPLQLAIEQTILEGWHTYWTNPGDSGEEMKIKWQLPAGFNVGELLWPVPERIPYGPLVNFGYRDHAVMLTQLVVPASASGLKDVHIKGRAKVLVCDEICIPEDHDLELVLPVAQKAEQANVDIFGAAAKSMPQTVDWYTFTEVDANELRVRIRIPEGVEDFTDDVEDIEWFARARGYVENAADSSAVFDESTRTLTLRQKRNEAMNPNKFTDGGFLLSAGDKAVFVEGKISTFVAPAMAQRGATSAPEYTNIWLMMAFAFVGGLILNLMPCVFPVLSMKALHLITLGKHERRHAQASGLFYVAGVVSMFVALAFVLIALRSAGAQLGWGFQLQNPAVVAGISWLLFVIGMNLAGLFDFRFVFGGEVLLAEKHHPLVTSYLTGVLATLVATPCSAPFMATALGAALLQPTVVAISVFAALGFGLAFPYALLCFVPALQGLLPRPGAWMAVFRQVLSFPMFASAVWLVWVVAQQGGPDAVLGTLGGMVALAFAIWLLDLRVHKKARRHVLMLAGAAIMALTLGSLRYVVEVPHGDAEQALPEKAIYKPYNTEAFDHALFDGNAPVFVNMTASWCITCLVNEKTTLDTDEVKALFREKGVVYFKGDWTNQNEAITHFLQRYGRTGVPLYVYFPAPDAATGKRPEAVVLPQILTPDIVYGALDGASE